MGIAGEDVWGVVAGARVNANGRNQLQPQVLRLHCSQSARAISLRMTIPGGGEKQSSQRLAAEFLAALHLAHHALLGFDAAASAYGLEYFRISDG